MDDKRVAGEGCEVCGWQRVASRSRRAAAKVCARVGAEGCGTKTGFRLAADPVNQTFRGFAHPIEEQFAWVLTEAEVEWEYEPTLFVLEREEGGQIKRAFRPDFYLPELGFYVELTTLERSGKKRRKQTEVAEMYGIKVIVLYMKELHEFTERFAWALAQRRDVC